MLPIFIDKDIVANIPLSVNTKQMLLPLVMNFPCLDSAVLTALLHY